MSGRRRGALPALGVAALSFSLAQTSMLPALPDMQRRLATGPEGVAWVVTSFLLAAAVFTPIAGRLGDMFGKRRVLLVALGVLACGCLVSAAGGSLRVVVAGRLLAGVGGAGVLPLCFGLVREQLPPERAGSGIGLVSATTGVGGGLGLLLGGAVVDRWSYPWIFVVVAVVALLAAAATLAATRESAARPGGRVDVRGAVLLAAGLALPLVAISQAGRWGWTAPPTLGLTAAGLAVLWLWLRLERTTAEPLVDVATLARPEVLITNVATLLVGFGMLGAFVLTPQLAQAPPGTGAGLGVSATTAGLILVPGAVAMLVLGPVSGWLGMRVGDKVPLTAGCLLTSAGLVLLAVRHDSTGALLAFGLVALAGVGLAFAAMPNLIVAAVPPGRTGEATGINALMRLVGASLGSQVTAAVLAGSATGSRGAARASGYTAGFLVCAAAALVAAVAARLVPARRPPAAARLTASTHVQGRGRRAPEAAEEVRDGVWLIRLPMPGRQPACVFAYLVRTSDGLILIDAGFDGAEGWEALVRATRAAGASPADIAAVLLTHLHPDHAGLARRVREASGAWVGAHELELRNAGVLRRAWSLDGAAQALRSSGMADGLSREVAEVVAARLPQESAPPVDRRLTDGEEIAVGERRLLAVWTPGHTPGHLAFHEPATGIVFAGDLLLPRTTPHVGADPTRDDNPLGDFLLSVDRVARLQPSLVLPGHEWVYRDASARAEQLAAHHHGRLGEVAGILAGESLTTWEVTQRMRWSRSLDEDRFAAFAATGEAAAHLRLLEVGGGAVRDETRTGVVVWSRPALAPA